ncbi:MAG: GNAT family protein [Cyanobacteria bacterium J06598_1]
MFSDQIAFEPSQASTKFDCQVSANHRLRQLEMDDASELFSLVDTNRTYLRRWLSWLNTTETIDDTRHFIRQTQKRAQDRQGFAAAVIHKGNIVGVAGLNGISWSDRSSSIGYWIAEPYQGKGLITRSCRAILDHAFQDRSLNRIAILCASQNVRSQAIPQRLGFTHEGRLRQAQWLYDHFVDHEVYSILSHEWKRQP